MRVVYLRNIFRAFNVSVSYSFKYSDYLCLSIAWLIVFINLVKHVTILVNSTCDIGYKPSAKRNLLENVKEAVSARKLKDIIKGKRKKIKRN